MAKVAVEPRRKCLRKVVTAAVLSRHSSHGRSVRCPPLRRIEILFSFRPGSPYCLCKFVVE